MRYAAAHFFSCDAPVAPALPCLSGGCLEEGSGGRHPSAVGRGLLPRPDPCVRLRTIAVRPAEREPRRPGEVRCQSKRPSGRSSPRSRNPAGPPIRRSTQFRPGYIAGEPEVAPPHSVRGGEPFQASLVPSSRCPIARGLAASPLWFFRTPCPVRDFSFLFRWPR